MNTASLVVIAVAVICGVSAFVCPRCTHPNDPNSCTETHNCTNANQDTCHLNINTVNGHNRVQYVCQVAANCHLHETQHCDLTVDGHCIFCCDSIAACKVQRDALFPSSGR
ncbi:hypothetical protein Bpfe_003889 [Biomphalaria pfeifferi]|uniref:Secreted protein n=1 Tax=Biomphalaria pfeifferi TaxID=112525 RepID=A0AAD8C5T7_BIOPF|nr:hypothetical protein Bpfe_003889 [Biomphalaria pfeifferi]